MFQITPERVEKDVISQLEFPHRPVEHTPDKITYLKKTLTKAKAIGRLYRKKIRIVFYDTMGLKEVETTVWSSDAKEIVLTDGITIPFNRVVDVKQS